MDDLFVKRAFAPDVDLRGEAAALDWLGEAEPTGGLHAARVSEATADVLREERIRTGAPSASAARRIGEGLARTHAAGAEWLGCPPPGAPAGFSAYVIDDSRTPCVPREEAPSSWGAFFAEWRIEPQVRQLRDGGDFDAGEAALLGRVCSRLAAGDFDAPQPALVEEAISASAGSTHPVTCARLHGDLWSGNVLWTARGASSPAALIDPMAHGGHAESDLAMLQLFGYPHLGEVLAGYDAASPLADGWRERVGLHQLAPLLLHCVLFGGGYVSQTLSVARRYA